MGDNHSLSEKVFHKLQEDILSGKYAVDEELKEKTIGDELGVSRTPVRAEQGGACDRIFQGRFERYL